MKLNLTASILTMIGLSFLNFTLPQKSITLAAISLPDSLYPSPNKIVSYHTKWAKNHYKERISYFKQYPLKLHDIVFIGNSIVEQGGDWGVRFNNQVQNS